MSTVSLPDDTHDVVYDAGALIAANRNDRRFAAIASVIGRAGIVPRVPATVLAQAWRKNGPRQANLARALKTCDIAGFLEQEARAAGELCGQSGTSDIVDASVVLLANRYRAAIVTSDRGDIEALIASLGVASTLTPDHVIDI